MRRPVSLANESDEAPCLDMFSPSGRVRTLFIENTCSLSSDRLGDATPRPEVIGGRGDERQAFRLPVAAQLAG
jgi:hypothetical protein